MQYSSHRPLNFRMPNFSTLKWLARFRAESKTVVTEALQCTAH